MRNFTPEKYRQLVEETEDKVLKSFMKAERDILSNILDSSSKTFIDLGAGYGRILPFLSSLSQNVISMEVNPKMIPELKRRSSRFMNSQAVEGNAINIHELLENTRVIKPVIIILQNTLGTIEGDYKELLNAIKSYARFKNGEIIISLFRQEALKEWGIKMYTDIQEMVGEPDLEKTDFDKGIFVSKTGYVSKWWNTKEVQELKDFFEGEIINEIVEKEFYIFHIKA